MWSATLLGLVLGVLAFFAWVNPGLWKWFSDNAAIAWVLLLGALMAIAFLIAERWRLEDEVERLGVSLAQMQRPNPTERDRALCAEVLRIWDPTGRLFRFLEMGFNAKRWRGDQAEPLYHFVQQMEHSYFDDQVVQAAFGSLYDAASELADWMSGEAAPIAEDNVGRPEDAPLVYSVRDGVVLGSWKTYDAMREEGLQSARAGLRASRDFERVARLRGL